MPSLPLDPRPERAPADRTDAAPDGRVAGAAPAHRVTEHAPVDPDAERARRRDRRTGIVALVVASVVLWALIAAAVAFAVTR
ncbi:hypothetical protein [Clavibacter sp. MX14-G9D]|uniref:hypothetical protein n=1 Tax=Clavibacter sp. MX14-G9D TaxID=3064656 RepID=UPI00293ED78C|nr:hypothetical protein [Clavibacter sp. MX14-G9D]